LSRKQKAKSYLSGGDGSGFYPAQDYADCTDYADYNDFLFLLLNKKIAKTDIV
jgi:hypothetical protein